MAFTAYTQNKTFEPSAYYSWLEARLGNPHWAVILDVIDGTVEQQKELLSRWPFSKELSAPVWHMAMPIDYLLYLCDQISEGLFRIERGILEGR